MRWKKEICRLLLLLTVVKTVAVWMEGVNVLAAEGEKLPPLIQTTTLEGDYKAAVSLELALTPFAREEDLEQAFENVLCSCVRIQVEGHYGSGSIYKMLENEIIIVTNRHVLQYWNEDSYVTFFNGRASGGTLEGISEEADLGFISVSIDDFTYEELLAFRNIRMCTNREDGEAARDSRIFSIDMASKWNAPVMMEGEILSPRIYLEDFQTEMLYAEGNAVPGMSGGGIFDGHGNYLGMLTGGTLQGELAAVPGEIIVQEYRKLQSKNQLT